MCTFANILELQQAKSLQNKVGLVMKPMIL